jgi:hypothetical protein
MTPRIAQNTLNFLLSDRMTFKGSDTLPLVEIIRELQQELNNGATTDPQGGPAEAED